MKDFENGKRCLSPSIFRKSKGPVILSSSCAAFMGNNQLEVPNKVTQSQSIKKTETIALAKDASIAEYDINQCLDLKDVHCKEEHISDKLF